MTFCKFGETWLPLKYGRSCLSEPPETVGDVLDLYARDQLGNLWNLGKRRTSEIEAALIFAGFDLTACRCQQREPFSPGSAEGKPEA